MTKKDWQDLSPAQRRVMAEGIRVFLQMTTKLDLTAARELEEIGLVRLVWTDTKGRKRSWLPELTSEGRRMAMQFFTPDEEKAAFNEPEGIDGQ